MAYNLAPFKSFQFYKMVNPTDGDQLYPTPSASGYLRGTKSETRSQIDQLCIAREDNLRVCQRGIMSALNLISES